MCERKILFQLKIYDRLRQATAKRTGCLSGAKWIYVSCGDIVDGVGYCVDSISVAVMTGIGREDREEALPTAKASNAPPTY